MKSHSLQSDRVTPEGSVIVEEVDIMTVSNNVAKQAKQTIEGNKLNKLCSKLNKKQSTQKQNTRKRNKQVKES
jgi:hypothetical protein